MNFKKLKAVLFVLAGSLQFCFVQSIHATQFEDSYYNIMKSYSVYKPEAQLTGLSLMIGGSAGLVTSLILGVTSNQTVPIVGYSLIQFLSAEAISRGAELYYTGDTFTLEAERLNDLARRLYATSNLTLDEKRRIMDSETEETVLRWRNKSIQSHRISGYVHFAAASACAATAILSKNPSTITTLTTLVLFGLATTIGISDILYNPNPKDYPKFMAGMNLFNEFGGSQLTLSYLW
jgi:hypothetical protein